MCLTNSHFYYLFIFIYLFLLIYLFSLVRYCHFGDSVCVWYYMSHVVRKPAFCICENKHANQFCGNREADQCLCFHCGSTSQFVCDLVEPRRPVFSERGSYSMSVNFVKFCKQLSSFWCLCKII